MLKHKQKKYTVNHGKLLKEAIKGSGYSIRYVAEKINKEYSTLFKWFEKETLDAGVFLKVGQVINHDFSPEIDGLSKNINEDAVPYNRIDLRQCIIECDRLRVRYIELLERHNALLERTSPAN